MAKFFSSLRSSLPNTFLGSQIGEETQQALNFTGSPWQLFKRDAYLFFVWLAYIPFICTPMFPNPSNSLNELYFRSFWNIYCMVVHFILIVSQTVFLVSLPWMFSFPFIFFVTYFVVFLLVNAGVCKVLLNNMIPATGLPSTPDERTAQWTPHPNETWIFLNGVSVGTHWLQSNIDRISRTFYRPVIGVHNDTYGIVFDIIQCLIQRCLGYATSDVRQCYVLVKKALYRADCQKVVLILHSQGGIEGSMILDWLLVEVPQNKLQALEVYTFGNAANHFNNPYRDVHSSEVASSTSPPDQQFNRAISHIEHYANSHDFVACWGILSCTETMPLDRFENRFMGRVFLRHGKGHLLNQHYLDNMFPLNADGYGVRPTVRTDFMEMPCTIEKGKASKDGKREDTKQSLFATKHDHELEALDAHVINESPTIYRQNTWSDTPRNGPVPGQHVVLKTKDFSRLWLYKNGESPPEYKPKEVRP